MTTPALNDDLVRLLRRHSSHATGSAHDAMREAAAALEAQANEIEALRSALAQISEYAHEATKAITGLVGGGSECFSGKIGDQYKADLAFCVERIRDREARSHERLLAENRKRREAEAARTALTGALNHGA